jgi:hypothetical protein
MVRGDPVPVGVGDLVVDPGEGASGRPGHQGPGLPAEPEPLVFAFMFADGSGQFTTGSRGSPIRKAISVFASSSQAWPR